MKLFTTTIGQYSHTSRGRWEVNAKKLSKTDLSDSTTEDMIGFFSELSPKKKKSEQKAFGQKEAVRKKLV